MRLEISGAKVVKNDKKLIANESRASPEVLGLTSVSRGSGIHSSWKTSSLLPPWHPRTGAGRAVPGNSEGLDVGSGGQRPDTGHCQSSKSRSLFPETNSVRFDKHNSVDFLPFKTTTIFPHFQSRQMALEVPKLLLWKELEMPSNSACCRRQDPN